MARVSRLARGAVALTAVLCGSPILEAQAEGWPSRVDAQYKIALNRLDLGTFMFHASFSGNSYVAEGHAQISALLGAFKWEGKSRSSGNLPEFGVQPAAYTFDFNGTGKSGSLKMGFNSGAVTNVAMQPVQPSPPDVVPLQPQHLKGVLDPLSTVLVLSRTASANPCGRRVPIFDGRQRLDLMLIPLRQQQIPESKPSGQPTVGIVCQVRYVPIAGHQKAEETSSLATSNGIEIMFRPVPSAGLFVPHQITVPIIAGSVTITAERVDIQTRQEQIALVN
ncbi:MAG: DUF3108 domain-containing protein [Proteobacteria bacterium]|nr:DUF3108 domain-containing protein [Pseudomonadota bacterium]